MMKRETIPIADIYVPTKRRATLEQKRVDEIAASILDKGLLSPILVRPDGAGFVLVEGLHRLEAANSWRRDHCRVPCRCTEALKAGWEGSSRADGWRVYAGVNFGQQSHSSRRNRRVHAYCGIRAHRERRR